MNSISKNSLNKKAIQILVYLGLLAFLVVPISSQAAEAKPTYTPKQLPFDPSQGDTSVTSSTTIDLGQNDPLTVTLRIINAVLTFLGLAFLVILIYAGVLWTLARGNQEEIDKAKKLLRQGLIGIVIILSSVGLARLVFFVVEGYNQGQDAEEALQYL